MNQTKTGQAAAFDPLPDAIRAGHCAVIMNGNLDDHFLLGGNVVYIPQYAARALHELGFVVIEFSLATGARIWRPEPAYRVPQALQEQLSRRGLQRHLNDRRPRNQQQELVPLEFFAELANLLRSATDEEVKLALKINYVEHLIPAGSDLAGASESERFMLEFLHDLSSSPAMSKAGNCLVCLSYRQIEHPALRNFMRIDFPYPTPEILAAYAERCKGRTGNSLEAGFELPELGNVSRGLQNRYVDSIFREAKAAGTPVTRARTLTAKDKFISERSGGILELLPTPYAFDDLVGQKHIVEFLKQNLPKMKEGSPLAVRNFLACGPPGTGKTMLAQILARESGFNVVKFNITATKGPLVGESEARLSETLRFIADICPIILVIDEISELVPRRGAGALDSGVSSNMLAELLMFTSRSDLTGRIMLYACTNFALSLDVALKDRFVTACMMTLTAPEIAECLPQFESRIGHKSDLDPEDEQVQEAVRILAQKGASPRRIERLVNFAALNAELPLRPDVVLAAAHDFVPAQLEEIALTTLSGLAMTSYASLYPWANQPDFDFEAHTYLDGIVDSATGALDPTALARRIHELKQQVTL